MGEVTNDRLASLIRWQEFVLTGQGREEWLQRVAERGVDGACAEMGLPRGRVLAFVAGHAALSEAMARALEMGSHVLVGEALDIADEDGFLIQRDRLRVETRLKVAGLYNRRDYGARVDVKQEVSVTVDAGLLAEAGDLLKLMVRTAPQERVVDGEILPAVQDSGLEAL